VKIELAHSSNAFLDFTLFRIGNTPLTIGTLITAVATVGGIAMFGAAGFVVGPVIAALFVTVWALYGETFKDVLPAVEP